MKKLYAVKDIAGLLDIQTVTLKKYCQLLENEGYRFSRNERNHRQYMDEDVIVLKKLLEVKEEPGITLENAAKQVVIWNDGIEVIPDKRYKSDDTDDTASELAIQAQVVKELHEQRQTIDQQGKILNLVLEELAATREQNQQLLSDMGKLLTIQQQLPQPNPEEENKILERLQVLDQKTSDIRENMLEREKKRERHSSPIIDIKAILDKLKF